MNEQSISVKIVIAGLLCFVLGLFIGYLMGEHDTKGEQRVDPNAASRTLQTSKEQENAGEMFYDLDEDCLFIWTGRSWFAYEEGCKKEARIEGLDLGADAGGFFVTEQDFVFRFPPHLNLEEVEAFEERCKEDYEE